MQPIDQIARQPESAKPLSYTDFFDLHNKYRNAVESGNIDAFQALVTTYGELALSHGSGIQVSQNSLISPQAFELTFYNVNLTAHMIVVTRGHFNFESPCSLGEEEYNELQNDAKFLPELTLVIEKINPQPDPDSIPGMIKYLKFNTNFSIILQNN